VTEFVKAISLYQPHATLVALGEKRFETRSWGTHHRGLLLIHAAHKRPPEYLKLAQTEPFRRALAKDPLWMVRRMQVIAAVNMANCIRIFSAPPREVLQFGNYELAYGDFSPGRWSWHFPDAVRFPEPFYARGGRKFFNVPAHQVLLATESWERCPAWWEKVEGWPGCRCKSCREKGEARAYY
jgi:hypothetical protein